MLVEIGDAPDRADDVRRFVHHDHGRGAEARAELAQRVEIHRDGLSLFRRNATNRRAAGNDGKQVVPAAANTAAVLVDQVFQRNTHFLFDDARTLDVAGNLKQLRAGVVRKTESREPARAAAQNITGHRDAFDVIDRRRSAVEADVRRKRRLQTRLALLAFKAFEHRGFFAADVGTGTVMHDEIKIPAVDVVLADELRIIRFVDGALQRLALADVFAAHVNIARVHPHREGREQRSFDEQMRIVAQNFAILAGTGLRLVGIDDEIARPRIGLRHERPLETRRKPGAAAAAQSRFLDLVDDVVVALVDEKLRAIPAPRCRAPLRLTSWNP